MGSPLLCLPGRMRNWTACTFTNCMLFAGSVVKRSHGEQQPRPLDAGALRLSGGLRATHATPRRASTVHTMARAAPSGTRGGGGAGVTRAPAGPRPVRSVSTWIPISRAPPTCWSSPRMMPALLGARPCWWRRSMIRQSCSAPLASAMRRYSPSRLIPAEPGRSISPGKTSVAVRRISCCVSRMMWGPNVVNVNPENMMLLEARVGQG
jgi:hypothetical protein